VFYRHYYLPALQLCGRQEAPELHEDMLRLGERLMAEARAAEAQLQAAAQAAQAEQAAQAAQAEAQAAQPSRAEATSSARPSEPRPPAETHHTQHHIRKKQPKFSYPKRYEIDP
jgi:hypothetical protein